MKLRQRYLLSQSVEHGLGQLRVFVDPVVCSARPTVRAVFGRHGEDAVVEALHLREGLVHRDGVRAGEDVARSLREDHGRPAREEALAHIPGGDVQHAVDVADDFGHVKAPGVLGVARTNQAVPEDDLELRILGHPAVPRSPC